MLTKQEIIDKVESIRKQKVELNRAKDLVDIALIDGFMGT